MPQACWQRTPYSSRNAVIIAGGHAEPPTTTCLSVLNLSRFCFIYARRPSHTVGTPALVVTFSDSNSSYRLLPSSPAPGNTNFAPLSGAQYGTPQTLVPNIGPTARNTDRPTQV